MTDVADDEDAPIELCCLLWGHAEQAEGLTAYEDRVLALVPEHGGEVVSRAISDGAGGRPHEVQLFRFPDQGSLDGYLADPRRVALADERDLVIARTELFPVRIVPAGPAVIPSDPVGAG